MPVYLVDHAAFWPPNANRVSTQELVDGVEALLAAGDLANPFFEQKPAVWRGEGGARGRG